ncbi:MAG: UPF0175 family protein [Phycisphaerales bacterium]|nr:UPF0175 family protein [Phycisphaerales bacterium]
MSVILDIDPQSQRALESVFGQNLSRSALEALVTEGYRAGKLSRFQVQQILGFPDRWSAEVWLKDHDAFPLTTLHDVISDSANSRRAREV